MMLQCLMRVDNMLDIMLLYIKIQVEFEHPLIGLKVMFHWSLHVEGHACGGFTRQC